VVNHISGLKLTMLALGGIKFGIINFVGNFGFQDTIRMLWLHFLWHVEAWLADLGVGIQTHCAVIISITVQGPVVLTSRHYHPCALNVFHLLPRPGGETKSCSFCSLE
jgi:hypothetical protein